MYVCRSVRARRKRVRRAARLSRQGGLFFNAAPFLYAAPDVNDDKAAKQL